MRAAEVWLTVSGPINKCTSLSTCFVSAGSKQRDLSSVPRFPSRRVGAALSPSACFHWQKQEHHQILPALTFSVSSDIRQVHTGLTQCTQQMLQRCYMWSDRSNFSVNGFSVSHMRFASRSAALTHPTLPSTDQSVLWKV